MLVKSIPVWALPRHSPWPGHIKFDLTMGKPLACPYGARTVIFNEYMYIFVVCKHWCHKNKIVSLFSLFREEGQPVPIWTMYWETYSEMMVGNTQYI